MENQAQGQAPSFFLSDWLINARKILEAFLRLIEANGGERVSTNAGIDVATVYKKPSKPTFPIYGVETHTAKSCIEFRLDADICHIELTNIGPTNRGGLIGCRISQDECGAFELKINRPKALDQYEPLSDDQVQAAAVEFYIHVIL